MARYFGFRDRLKKKTRNLSISEKDIEWLKVATSFSWSPARRDYQWLEPEDYLSSFLNSSLPKEGEGTVSSSDPEGYVGADNISFENGQEGLGNEYIEEESDYVPPYDFNPVSGEDSIHGIKSDILADLPHIDEYKLEISSALQRRGIHVDADSIQVPDELAFHLNNYHEKGRSSLDSYELRARLQYFKKQVIESYEQLNTPPGGFQVYDETITNEGPGTPGPESVNGLDNLDEDEKFIVSSLDRLEASLRGEVEEPVAPPADEVDDGFPDDNSGGDSYSVSFSNPPSSFADDSWLVLPIDAPPEAAEPSFLSDSVRDVNNNRDNEDEIFSRPGGQPTEQKSTDDSKKRTPLFKSSKQPDSKEVLKALDSINTNQRDEKKNVEDPSAPMPTIDPVLGTGESQGAGYDANDSSDSANAKKDFSLFNRKDKADSNGGSRERRLFDGKRKTTKEQRKEVTLPGISTSAPKEEPQEKTPPPVEFRTEVKFPGEYRTEVLLPGQKREEPKENAEEPVKQELPQTEDVKEVRGGSSLDSTSLDNDDAQEGEVSLTELLLKLRNDSDLSGSSSDTTKSAPEEPVVKDSIIEKHRPNFTESSDGSALETDDTISFSLNTDENLQEPLVDPLEALAKPKKTVEKPPKETVIFPDIPLSPVVDNADPPEDATPVFPENGLGEVDMSPADEGLDLSDFSTIISNDTASTDSPPSDSSPSDSPLNDSQLSDSPLSNSAPSDSAPSDSPPIDNALSDSPPSDSALSDTGAAETERDDSMTVENHRAEPLAGENNLPYASEQESVQEDDLQESQETMNQRRARYIEEER
nr:hypothetical protein [Rhodothermaceae bacterium]